MTRPGRSRGRAVLIGGVSFPLTPALSLGERENRQPIGGESNPLGRAAISALKRAAHGDTKSDIRLEKDAGCLFPAPHGPVIRLVTL